MASAIQSKKDTIWTHNFIVLFFANTVTYFGSYLTYTLLPLHCRGLGASDSVVGIVSAMFALTALAIRPVSAPAIDSWNKKTLYLIVITMNAIIMFGYGISKNIPMIVFFRLMHGISNGTSAALCLTMATEALPDHKISSGLAVYMLSNVIPSAVGPGLGLAISSRWGYPVTYTVASVLILMATIVGTRLEYDGPHFKKLTIKLDTFIAKEAVVPAILMAVMQFAACTISSFLVLMTTDRELTGLSTYYTITAVAAVASRPIAGKLADRFGSTTILYPSLALFMINLALLAFCDSNIALWAAGIINAFGYTVFYSQLQAHAMKITPAEKRGAGSSTCYVGTDVGALLGPMAAGVIADHFGYTVLYLYGLIPLALCAVIMYFWLIKTKKTAAA